MGDPVPAPAAQEAEAPITSVGPLIVTGASGVGKTSVVNFLRKKYPECIETLISHTTRPRRATEIDGVSYHFVSRERFDEMCEKGEMIEWTEYAGNMYGTAWESVATANRTGRVVIMDIDWHGVQVLCEAKGFPRPLVVLLVPRDFSVIEDRLRERGLDTDEAIQARVAQGMGDMEKIKPIMHLFDLQVVNEQDRFDETFALVEDAVTKYYPIFMAAKQKQNGAGPAIPTRPPLDPRDILK